MNDNTLKVVLSEVLTAPDAVNLDFISKQGDINTNIRYCGRAITKQLTDLRAIALADRVELDLSCRYHQLTDLRGSPRHVGGDFRVTGNPVKSLDGIPNFIGRSFILGTPAYVYNTADNSPVSSSSDGTRLIEHYSADHISFENIHQQLDHLGADFFISTLYCRKMVGILDFLKVKTFDGELICAQVSVTDDGRYVIHNEATEVFNVINECRVLGRRRGLLSAQRRLSVLAKTLKHVQLLDFQ